MDNLGVTALLIIMGMAGLLIWNSIDIRSNENNITNLKQEIKDLKEEVKKLRYK